MQKMVEILPHPDQFPRFDAKVDTSGDCWLWSGAVNDYGYGVFGLGIRHGGSLVYAHRYSFVRAGGVLIQDSVLDHLCRVPSCVKPSHLEQVTTETNTERGTRRVPKMECKYGHPMSGENLYVSPKGERGCRTCQRRWTREYKARRRAA